MRSAVFGTHFYRETKKRVLLRQKSPNKKKPVLLRL
jgi:hypothetical protein